MFEGNYLDTLRKLTYNKHLNIGVLFVSLGSSPAQ